MNQADNIKSILMNDVSELASHPEKFAKNPATDFTRMRKISAEDTLLFPILMERDSISRELLKYFNHSTDTPTMSAYYQQRRKLLPDTFHQLFLTFNSHFEDSLYMGKYVLTAVDGSGFNLFFNPHDPVTFIPPNNSSERGHNEIHITAASRLIDRTYSDAVIQPSPVKNEFRAVCELVDRDPCTNGIPLYLTDRGFACFNYFAHCKENGIFFLTRIKKSNIQRLLRDLMPENEEEFDITVDRIIVRTNAKKNRSLPDHPELYRYIDKNTAFDYIEPSSPGEYHLCLRAVCVKIDEGTYEYLVTNLSRDEFDLRALCDLYHLRWGCETFFRELKHVIGASDFHSKSLEYVTHEVWSRLILYNFCSRITALVVVEQKDTKHQYQVNYTMAIKNCHDYLRQKGDSPPIDIMGLIGKYTCPVRPKRNFPRRKKFQTPMKFTYRY